ncbi:MAG: hypothetical protein LBG60_04950 [Bifidobacteriaceae bacterium]|nr:hypothetical protein [Bifidobacteriaceae bacterium]
MAVIVETLGVHHKWSRRLPKAVTDQLWLAHNLREDLVSQTLAYEAAVKAVWSSYPAVAAVEADLAIALAAKVKAEDDVKALKVRTRSNRASGPEVAVLKTAEADLRRLRRDLSDEKKRVYAIAADQFAALNQEFYDAQKALYGKYCQQGVVDRDGRTIYLYWGTFHEVKTHHEAAAKRIAKARRELAKAPVKGSQPKPRWPQFRHHRYTGEGTLAVEVRPTLAKAPRSPSAVGEANGPHRNTFSMPWTDPAVWERMTPSQRRQAGRLPVRMRIGGVKGHATAGQGVLEIPVQAHRMLPLEAEITGAKLTVRRYGSKTKAVIHVTARLPDPEPVDGGPDVVVRWTWRKEGEALAQAGRRNSNGVAQWSSTSPIEVPDNLREYMLVDRNKTAGIVVLPKALLDRFAAADRMRSRMDLAFNAVLAGLVEWLKEVDTITDPTSRDEATLTAVRVAGWKNPNRLIRLAQAWAENPPPDASDLVENLANWADNHRRLHTREALTRRRAVLRREWAYRNIAAMFARQAGRVGLVDLDLAGVAERKPGSSTDHDVPAAVEDQASSQRMLAASGSLRLAIAQACAREGVAVVNLDSAHSTRRHIACGVVNPADGRSWNRVVECDGCGQRYDQGENALAHLSRKLAATS